MQMYIQERLANGATKRVPALDVFKALSQPTQANQFIIHLYILSI